MNLSLALNILFIVAFMIDRLFRLRSAKEYKEAKEAQIATLKQQLEAEQGNNDVRITELHKQRYENLKLLLDERELELDHRQAALLELQIAVQENAQKEKLLNLLIDELNRGDKSKLSLELKRQMFLQQMNA